MNAGIKPINDIFNGNRILEIPFFQRAYVWGESQWERFLEDMMHVSKTKTSYFLGSVILKQQPTQTRQQVSDIRTVVDGQQRLTTLNIFCKVLCLLNDSNSLFDRVFKLISNDISLLHNHNDIESFNNIVNLTKNSKIDSTDTITEAYNYFLQNMNKDTLDFQAILTNLQFVVIDLDVKEDEQQIFDTINSLGVRLTTAELLKNYLFGRSDIKSYNENWKDIFENDADSKEFWDREITTGRSKRSNIDIFLYSFLQINIQTSLVKIKSSDKILFGRVDGLFESFKRFIETYDIHKYEIIHEIKEYATIYRRYVDHTAVNRPLNPSNGIERINAIIFGLENSTIIPYFLYLLKNIKDSDELNSICGYLETYILRRIICKETTANYNQLFSEQLILNEIKEVDKLKTYIGNLSTKVNRMPTDDDLHRGFFHSKLNNKQASSVLYFIESKIRDYAKHSTSLLGLSHYSLEHIMPKKWENNWNNISSDEAKILRNKTLLTLGNLTIITASLNSSIRDADWITKKEGKNGKKGLKQYSSGIEIFQPYLDKADWNEDTISERAHKLYTYAKAIWSIGSSSSINEYEPDEDAADILPKEKTFSFTPEVDNSDYYGSVVTMSHGQDINASGIYTENKKILVQKGSQASLENKGSLQENLLNKKNDLIQSGSLRNTGVYLLFTKDVLFSSSSEAAGIIAGSSTNGRIKWKFPTGQTIKDLDL